MKAAQLVGAGRFEVVEVDPRALGEGEVLVAMERASICGSDLHAVLGHHLEPVETMPPGAPGHEGIGTVVESRAERFGAGDRVLTVPMPGAGGCFAEQQVIGADFLVEVPDGSDPARLLLAQQLGTAVNGFRCYWPEGRDAEGATAAILGAGSAGLFLLQLAKLAGFATIVVGEVDERRLKVAGELGAQFLVNASGDAFVETVRDVTGGLGADLVIEAAGRDGCRADCVKAVRHGGRIGYFGLPEHPGLVPFPFEGAFRSAVTIAMSGNAQLEPGLVSFRQAIELIRSGAVSVEPMLEPVFPLARFEEAFAAARDHLGVKVAIDLTPSPAG